MSSCAEVGVGLETASKSGMDRSVGCLLGSSGASGIGRTVRLWMWTWLAFGFLLGDVFARYKSQMAW